MQRYKALFPIQCLDPLDFSPAAVGPKNKRAFCRERHSGSVGKVKRWPAYCSEASATPEHHALANSVVILPDDFHLQAP